ncbi:MAG: N-acetylmuramoyl-L-alanine amidase [Victivallaceae bacterium]|nr:N-acetylmuramoyl-L-alanine amidase [Victivallaceae bacterium]
MKWFNRFIASATLLLVAAGCAPSLAPFPVEPKQDKSAPAAKPEASTPPAKPSPPPSSDAGDRVVRLPGIWSGDSPAAVRSVLIDPGHGGDDPGARGAFTQEKELNLDLARRLAAELRRRGFLVAMTRDCDVFVPLDERGAMTGRLKADIFVSIHHNASVNASASGIETYVLRPGVDFEPVTHMRNVLLAAAIQRELRSALPWAIDRGVRAARFRVLVTSTSSASVLVEAGFVSNAGEEKKIASPEVLQKSAAAVASGLVFYAGLTDAMGPATNRQDRQFVSCRRQ